MPDHPLISVIIPTYNRPEPLRVCLEALAQLDFPRDAFEVIVVDDGSSRSLEPVVRQFRDRLPINLIAQSRAGAGIARNTGAAQARGRYLAFTDDDCMPQADWLKQLRARLEAGLANQAFGGRVVNLLADNIYSIASQVIIDAIYEHGGAGGNSFFTSNNFALPIEVFQAVGGFYPHDGEDRDFCDRLLSLGLGLCYAPEVVVRHAHPMNLARFWRVHYHYGCGAYHFHRAQAGRNQGRYRFHPLSAFLLLQYPLWPRWRWKAPALAGLLVLSKIANVAGYFVEAVYQCTGSAKASANPTRARPPQSRLSPAAHAASPDIPKQP